MKIFLCVSNVSYLFSLNFIGEIIIIIAIVIALVENPSVSKRLLQNAAPFDLGPQRLPLTASNFLSKCSFIPTSSWTCKETIFLSRNSNRSLP